ncbi:RdgB/HAM1 family non-canonical purine NTP pyrophosphatase [Legionella spiritensis]|nr:RdgB/HAM1 family non-canonical purine NTP pyrophosphatase [Legionella spiritensis]
MKKIILATGNPGKIAELSTLLAPITCIPQAILGIRDVAETGLSFVENAIIKARHASQIADQPALADDSGLVVPALHGEPGIFSSRFAGEQANDKDNMALLLDKLRDIPENERQAYFYCAIVVVQHGHDPTPLIACGRIDGRINTIAAGEHGFGYDPVFYLNSHRCTMAQLPAKIKNNISHRARALRLLQQQLTTLL